jgi:hypothetical protein
MFESSSIPIDYDPLANIAEFAITYNQKYGTNHPQFYQGSYSQVSLIFYISSFRDYFF